MGRSAGLDRTAQVSAALASAVPATAAWAARMAATAGADCCGSGRPTRIGVADCRDARILAKFGVPPAAASCAAAAPDSASTTGLFASDGCCPGVCTPAAAARSTQIEESGIQTSAPAGPLATTAAGSTVVTVTEQPATLPEPVIAPITSAMSGAAATFSVPSDNGQPPAPWSAPCAGWEPATADPAVPSDADADAVVLSAVACDLTTQVTSPAAANTAITRVMIVRARFRRERFRWWRPCRPG